MYPPFLSSATVILLPLGISLCRYPLTKSKQTLREMGNEFDLLGAASKPRRLPGQSHQPVCELVGEGPGLAV